MMYSNLAATKNFVVKNNVFCDATESLIRLDYNPGNPDWPSAALTLDGNRYFNDGGRNFFRWLGEEIPGSEFDAWREKTGYEKQGLSAPPEKPLSQLKHWNHVY